MGKHFLTLEFDEASTKILEEKPQILAEIGRIAKEHGALAVRYGTKWVEDPVDDENEVPFDFNSVLDPD